MPAAGPPPAEGAAQRDGCCYRRRRGEARRRQKRARRRERAARRERATVAATAEKEPVAASKGRGEERGLLPLPADPAEGAPQRERAAVVASRGHGTERGLLPPTPPRRSPPPPLLRRACRRRRQHYHPCCLSHVCQAPCHVSGTTEHLSFPGLGSRNLALVASQALEQAASQSSWARGDSEIGLAAARLLNPFSSPTYSAVLPTVPDDATHPEQSAQDLEDIDICNSQPYPHHPSTTETKQTGLPTPDFTFPIRLFRDFMTPPPKRPAERRRTSEVNADSCFAAVPVPVTAAAATGDLGVNVDMDGAGAGLLGGKARAEVWGGDEDDEADDEEPACRRTLSTDGNAGPIEMVQACHGGNQVGELFPTSRLYPLLSLLAVLLGWNAGGGDVQRADGSQGAVSSKVMQAIGNTGSCQSASGGIEHSEPCCAGPRTPGLGC